MKGGDLLINPFARFARNKQTARSPDSATPPSSGNAKTERYPYSYLGFGYMPRKFETTRQLDITKFKNYNTNDLLDLLRHNHPETSFAIWQYLRVANSALTCKAKGIRGNDDERGQKVLDRILWKLNHPPTGNQFQEAKGMNLITGQLLLNAMMRGGVGGELVLNQLGKMDRIQPFDTASIYFQNENGRLVPYQRQSQVSGMGYTKIDYPTVFYHPLDPAPDDPYGSSPLISLIQVVAWQIGFLNDLQAAVHQTGYPRMRVKLLEEIAKKNAPGHVQNDPVKYREWMDKIRDDVEKAMKNLKPDSIPVLWDSADLDLIGKGGSGQMVRVDAVVNTINKSLAAALKTLSSILGIGENTSKESYAAELKLYSRGIESVQQVVESLLERALTMALNLEGVRGWVDVEFAPVDLRSELQVVAELQTRQDIIIAARMRGAISDYEEMKAHREVLGYIGEPENFEELLAERKAREERNAQPEEYPRHGSPPATQ